MTEEAFAMIADPIDGRVPISWKYVPCQTSETIKINFKEGSSEFWTAIQFRDIEHGISTMEYLNNSDQWIAVNRELFNFFIETSGISSPMTLRATSVLGEQLIFEDIILDLASDFDTGKQFSTPQECLLLSTPDFATKNIVVYPNPTSEKLYIINNTKNWVLSDSHGKKITEGNANFINTFTLESGLYFLSIDNKKAEKIIVK